MIANGFEAIEAVIDSGRGQNLVDALSDLAKIMRNKIFDDTEERIAADDPGLGKRTIQALLDAEHLRIELADLWLLAYQSSYGLPSSELAGPEA